MHAPRALLARHVCFAEGLAREKNREMMKTTLLLSFLASARAHGSGAWKDPNHWKEDGNFAGMRYISEGPPHSLTIVGSGESSLKLSVLCCCRHIVPCSRVCA